MSQTFLGINTALRGLEAQQTAIEITSHNVANATTPGYSRQLAIMQTTDPSPAPTMEAAGAGQLGTGVNVTGIQRAHDTFVQQQIIYQNGAQAQQQAQSDTLSSISQVFNDPTSQGFSTLLSSYLTSWQQLANNPSDGPTRSVVAVRGAELANGFVAASKSLQQLQQEQDKQVGQYVQQINGLSAQIAALNQQIVSVQALGQQPNDLMDKRDGLINTLSQVADISYNQMSNGEVSINLGNAGALVQGASSFKLTAIPDPSHPPFTGAAFQGQTTALTNLGGQLGGAITARDTTIGGQLTALDSLANNVITAVNGFQTAGYGSNGATGITFFTGSNAGSMAVDPRIQTNVANIATASAPNLPGDGSVALQISQLQENPPPGGTGTLQAQYGDMIGQLGVSAQQAQANVKTGALVLQQLNAQQSSVSGVSLDEEASNLIQYQSAYQAAARVISIMNQTISDMINEIGR